MKKVAAVAIGAALIVALVFAATKLFSSAETAAPAQPLWQYMDSSWSALLGGEAKVTDAQLDEFAALHPGLTDEQAAAALPVLTGAAISNLTSAPWGNDDYDPPFQGESYKYSPRCSDVSLLALSPASSPDYDGWAKGMALFSGTCDGRKYSASAPGVEFVYAQRSGTGYVPRRPWETPGSGAKGVQYASDPGSLVEVSCSQGLLARPRVAAAFSLMCAAAKKDGVTLTADSAFRTVAEQTELFDRAVEAYGSPASAAEFVSPADGVVCSSKHCVGAAISIVPSKESSLWLAAPASCLPSGSAPPCGAGQTPVSNAESFGFASPPPSRPGYLEYALPYSPSPDGAAAADCWPYGDTAPTVIASVFRCRLAEAGIPSNEASKAAAKAIEVASCASGMDPSWRALLTDSGVQPTGGITHGGLFSLVPTTPSWQSGDLTDPVAAANYAAKLYIADRSFSRFYCATGSSYSPGPVLPEFGGNKLSKWALSW